jgi:hypothetical protein
LIKKISKFIGKSQMNFMTKSVMLIAVTALVAACGGGGGGSPAALPSASTLSVTQTNFETSVLSDSWVRYDWSLPSTNVAPTTGTHFLYEDRFSAPSSPTSGAVTGTISVVNVATTLALPTLTQRYVSRILKNGTIYLANHDSKATWSYLGSDVLSNQYASDGVTLLSSTEYDSWSTPNTLTGQIGNATIVKSFLGFTRITGQPINYDFTKSWLPGSSYFTRKGFLKNDTLYLRDWTGTTYTTAVTPYGGIEATIEAYFSNSSIVTAGGFNYDSVLYNLASGTIGTLEGARVWVANTKRPTSASPTDAYITLVELNGKIYFGFLEKAGSRFNVLDGVDATIVNDYNIRLNSTAASSIQAAIKF